MNNHFTCAYLGLFEHDCSLDKVRYNAVITSKSVVFQCLNCHQKIFYRKVIVEHQV